MEPKWRQDGQQIEKNEDPSKNPHGLVGAAVRKCDQQGPNLAANIDFERKLEPKIEPKSINNGTNKNDQKMKGCMMGEKSI